MIIKKSEPGLLTYGIHLHMFVFLLCYSLGIDWFLYQFSPTYKGHTNWICIPATQLYFIRNKVLRTPCRHQTVLKIPKNCEKWMFSYNTVKNGVKSFNTTQAIHHYTPWFISSSKVILCSNRLQVRLKYLIWFEWALHTLTSRWHFKSK